MAKNSWFFSGTRLKVRVLKKRESRLHQSMLAELRQARGTHNWATLLARWELANGEKWPGIEIGRMESVMFITNEEGPYG